MESASEIALLVGCLLVVAGLFFEDWIAAFRVSGEVAVIIGVMIEGLADGGIFLAAGKLRVIQDAELEILRLKAAQSNEHAQQAKRDTAKMALQLESARKDTVTLANELLELERVLRVRRYTPIVR